MEDRLWSALNRKHGVFRDDPSSWKVPPGSGLQPLRTHAVFEPIGGAALYAALDGLIGQGRWKEPKHWGQFLVTFPVAEGTVWAAKVGWHTDFPYFLPVDRLVGALVFSFIGQVPPKTGATLVIAGSHKIVGRFIDSKPHLRKLKMKVARLALMSSDPWLTDLCTKTDEDDWAGRLLGREHTVGGVDARVVELTGEPGDIVIGHPWLLHTSTPNLGDRPRFMRVQRITPSAYDGNNG